MGAPTGEVLSVYGFVDFATVTELRVFIGQAWSLKAEAGFYALVPIAAWLVLLSARRLRLGRRLRIGMVVALPVAVAAFTIWVDSWWTLTPDPTTARDLFFYHVGVYFLYQFMAGVMLAGLESFLPQRFERLGRSHLRASWLLFHSRRSRGLRGLLLHPALRPELQGAGRVVDIPGDLSSPGRGADSSSGPPAVCWRLLDMRPLRWIGQRSYSIYLVHFVIVGRAWALAGAEVRLQLQADVRRAPGGIACSQYRPRIPPLPACRGALHEPEDLQLACLGAGGRVEAGSTVDSFASAGAALVARGRGARSSHAQEPRRAAPEPAPTAEPSGPPTVPGA